MMAASRTSRVIGPALENMMVLPMPPCRGSRPLPGYRPYTPHSAAGMRIEPPPSLASATGVRPAATVAAEPPLDPPGLRPRSQGLRHSGSSRLTVRGNSANSGRLVLPMMTAPAARSRATCTASSSGTKSR